MIVQNIVDDVCMDFYPRVVCSSKRRGAQVADTRGSSSDEHDLSSKNLWVKLFFQDIGDRVVMKRSPRSLVVDQHLPKLVGAKRQLAAEINSHNSCLVIIEIRIQ